jgi:hypothetical protein
MYNPLLPSYAFMSVLAIEIRFTYVNDYSSAAIIFRMKSETMNFDQLRRHAGLRTIASQGFMYIGQPKVKNNRMPRAEFEPANPAL